MPAINNSTNVILKVLLSVLSQEKKRKDLRIDKENYKNTTARICRQYDYPHEFK